MDARVKKDYDEYSETWVIEDASGNMCAYHGLYPEQEHHSVSESPTRSLESTKNKSIEINKELMQEQGMEYTPYFPNLNFSKVEKLLMGTSPCLISFLPRFKEMCVCDESLQSLREEDIRDIFKKEIGFRGIFSNSLRAYIDGTNSCSHFVPSSKNNIDNQLQEQLVRTSLKGFVKYAPYHTDIKAILRTHAKGQLVLKFYEQKKFINEKYRKMLMDVIVSWSLSERIWISREDFVDLVTKITETFDGEKMSKYYIPAGISGSNPKGSLYHKYYNKITSMRKAGFPLKNTKRSGNISKKLIEI